MMTHDTKGITTNIAELRGHCEELQRVLAGQSKGADILRAWKRMKERYPVHHYKSRRDAAQIRVNDLKAELSTRKENPELEGKTAVERCHELQELQELRYREIEMAKSGCIVRAIINEGIVRERLELRKDALKARFKLVADDMEVNLEKRKAGLAAVIVEKQPEAQRRVKAILDEHKKDMELLQGRYEHALSVMAQDRKVLDGAEEAKQRMEGERDALVDRLRALKRKSAEQRKILAERDTAVAYNTIDECLHEVRRCTTYLSHVGVEAPQYAEEGFYVGNEDVRPSELITQREVMVPAMRRYLDDAAAAAEAERAAALAAEAVEAFQEAALAGALAKSPTGGLGAAAAAVVTSGAMLSGVL